MKKLFGIFAVMVLSVGLFSCEDDSAMEDTQALYETLKVDASDGEEVKTDIRGDDD